MATDPAPCRVLLLTGRSNHDWKATTAELKMIYAESGRFAVDVSEAPSSMDAALLAKYDVVVSNWSGFPQMNERQWGDRAEKALADFVRGGKGFALFHAATASFHTWPEFQQLAGATWGGETGHGRIHEFKVTIADVDHPVTRGMRDFIIRDELWHRMQAHPDRRVLCTARSALEQKGSGQDEPVVLCTQLGKGRGFSLILGHDADVMRNIAWRTLMLRGTEWAATGAVTIAVPDAGSSTHPVTAASDAEIEAALDAICRYEFGQRRGNLMAVEKLVFSVANDAGARRRLAGALAQRLASGATADARRFMCRQLSLIGSEAEVPALAALLNDKDLGLEARSALARIPGEPAMAAIRAAAEKASGEILVGLINTLGQRRDTKAVAFLSGRLTGESEEAGAAIDALGWIGGGQSAKALLAAGDKSTPALRARLAGAMLLYAEGLLASGQTAEAAGLYERLSGPHQPRHIRVAAFPGRVACRPDQAASVLQQALAGSDPALQSAAIRCARQIGNQTLTKILADQLANLPPDIQVQMLQALADRGDSTALPAVMVASRGQVPTVRLAAINALAAMGNAETAAYLAELASRMGGGEQRAVRAALVRLKGEDVDPALIRLVGGGESSVRREAVIALDSRGALSAAPCLLSAAEDSDRDVARQALQALGRLAGEDHRSALLAMHAKTGSADIRSDIETALVAIARRTGVDSTVAAILGEMPKTDPLACASLVRVLGRLGGEPALAAVRGVLKAPENELRDAAIRSLSEWPDDSAMPTLMEAARAARDSTTRVLALRGLARMAGNAPAGSAERNAQILADAMKLADRPEEKKALLAALAKVPGLSAMQQAEAAMDDPALVAEAGHAAVQIAEAIWQSHQADTRVTMEKVRQSVAPPPIRERAAAVLVALSRPVNLAIGAKASSPDGLEKDGEAGGDQAAIDGDPRTYWDEEDGKGLYRLRIELPAEAEVSSISIFGWRHHQFSPKDFDILCDDKVVKSVRGAVYDNNRLIVEFTAVRCRTMELKITAAHGPSPAIRELEIYQANPPKP